MEKVKDLQVYEISYWLISTLSEEKVDEIRAKFQSVLSEHGALVIKEAEPVLKDIAYPVDKIIDNKRVWFTTGYFGWIKFDVEPEKIKAIDEAFDHIEEIIRKLVVKTVREDTISHKKKTPKVATMSAPKLDNTDDVSSQVSLVEKVEVDIKDGIKEEIDEVTLDEKIEDIVGGE